MSVLKEYIPALVAGSVNQTVMEPTPIEQFNILFTRPSLCPSLNAISDINRRRNTYANDFILGIVERIYILELARGKSMPSDFLWKVITMSQKNQRFCVAYPFRACTDCGKKCALCSQPLIEIRNRWRESGWTLKELNCTGEAYCVMGNVEEERFVQAHRLAAGFLKQGAFREADGVFCSDVEAAQGLLRAFADAGI